MTITFLQLTTFVLALFVFMLSPGPGVFATIAKAMTEGAWAVLPLAIGLAAGDAVYMVFSAIGLSALATNYHTLFNVITLIGAGYLFYLAWKMWTMPPIKSTNAAQGESIDDSPSGKTSVVKTLLSGFLISSSNPKTILFYISLLPSFFPVVALTNMDIVLLCIVIFICAALSMMVYGFMAHFAQKKLKSPRSQQQFNRAGATLMGTAGIWLIIKGGST